MSVPIDDRGLLLGDGLFETLLVVGGAPVWWAEHMARLRRGCGTLGLPEPTEDAALAAAAAAMAGATHARAALRLTWTAGSGGRGLDRPSMLGPRLLSSLAPAPRSTSPLRLAIAQVRRNGGSPASRHKTLAYLDNVLARREAQVAGADEAVMLNTDGEVACAAAANIFWMDDGDLFTPALECGVLDGLARAAVMDRAAALGVTVREVRAGPEALAHADAVFLTNSLVGLRPAATLEGRGLANPPLLDALAADLP
ncbi:aminotransferase class IV [Phenylobacterium sp.]|uniref:aminotransferase class IV n=1 Tax=Phenylobacterium sp. TaxID=1871053 RepID=UPI0027301985|nr:aminotransferase class IV [Phenylobacterium sp.]MDP1617142.1 aminotransferase class IV [Phenylobacterium sp.]MDP1989032.1 aminotransferase class IV [Phenylobacterium sp.]